jgi:predicted dienelactone hydrolase
MQELRGLLFVLAMMTIANAADADPGDIVGTRRISVVAPERGMMLTVTVWYPAEAGGTTVTVGDNAVFQGAPARQDAPIAAGSFPLILLSHGGLRSALDSGAWIAARLAAQGFVVAAPAPPRLEGPRAKDAPKELWLRPADLAATLNAVQSDPALRARLDAQAIGILGFQFGGTVALALVGARIDGQQYAHSCDQDRTAMDCAWFARVGIDLHGVDVALARRSNLDRRVRAAIAVDPELSQLFDPASLMEISAPVSVISLGEPDSIRPGLDASRLARAIPKATYDTVTDAIHFSAFDLCKPQGAAILREERDQEELCNDGRRPRAEVHALLAEMTATFFRAHLQ